MKAAEILSIVEIGQASASDLIDKPVRSWGRIGHVNIEDLWIEVVSPINNEHKLKASIELLPNFDGFIGDLIQFVGDIDKNMRMQIKFCVKSPDLDVKLLESVLGMRRNFLQSESVL